MSRSLCLGFTSVVALLAATTLLAPLATAHAEKIPDTPAGTQLAALLAAIADGDIPAYVSEHMGEGPGAKEDVDFMRMVRRMHGGFDVQRIETSSPTSIVAIVESRNKPGNLRRVEVTVAPDPPHGIVGWGIDRFAGGAGGSSPSGDGGQVVITKGGPAAGEVDADGSNGGVAGKLETLIDLVAKNDEALTRRTAGELFAERLVEAYGEDGLVSFVQTMNEELGGTFDVKELTVDGPHRAHAILVDAVGDENKLAVETAPIAPHGLMGFRLAAVGEDGEVELPDFGSLDDALDHLESLADDGNFSGVVFVHHPDGEITERAYGHADREAGRKNTTTTQFNTGSITKLMTMIGIIQLEEKGRLSTGDAVGRYVDGLPEEIAAVTLDHLLTHRSGVPDYTMVAGPKVRPTLRTIDDHLPLLAGLELEFEPGTQEAYSNSGYLLLGKVIESVTGQRYHDYVKEEIFERAGLRASGFPDVTDLPDDAAHGYSTFMPRAEDGGRGRIASMTRPIGQSDGGSFASAHDLFLFRRALGDGKLLSERNSRRVLNRLASDEPMTGSTCDAGGAPGVSAMHCIDHDENLHVIVLANMDEPIAETVGRAVLRAVRAESDGS